MIQDISPERLDNAYKDLLPELYDKVISFHRDKVLVRFDDGKLGFPCYGELNRPGELVYAFTAANQRYFLLLREIEGAPDFSSFSLRELRTIGLHGNLDIFIVYTAYHLWKWYENNYFCGRCGNRTVLARDERALVCPHCNTRAYPRINPAVIVGVINGERLLITKYKGRDMNALIAGFTEIGETVEQTVAREVMEEVGLRVKNIWYYKSQPWGIASDLLLGFYCEVDGEDIIHRDDGELGYAEWVPRKEIILQPSDHSLTNEMMKMFRDGNISAGKG